MVYSDVSFSSLKLRNVLDPKGLYTFLDTIWDPFSSYPASLEDLNYLEILLFRPRLIIFLREPRHLRRLSNPLLCRGSNTL